MAASDSFLFQARKVLKRTLYFMVVGALSAVVCACFTRRDEGISPTTLTPESWIVINKPGVHHERLAVFVGEWDVTLLSRSAPEAPPNVSDGVSHISPILGGRFVREEFTGAVAGERYEGIGILGFDNGAQVFSSVWIDSLNTSVAVLHGRWNDTASMFRFLGEVYDPLLGRKRQTEMHIKVISPNHYEVSTIDFTPRGESFEALQMVYRKRVKSGSINKQKLNLPTRISRSG